MKKAIGSNYEAVFGLHTVMSMLKYEPKRIASLFIARSKDTEELFLLANAAGVQPTLMERHEFEKRFQVGKEAQGIVAHVAPYQYVTLADLIDKNPPTILAMDSWHDAMNVGRAARSALCFGVDSLIVCKDRSAPINAAAQKAAVGALSRQNVARVNNLAAALTTLKKHNYFIYGADGEGQLPIGECDFAQKSVVVIGAEGEGLRSLTKKLCDVTVRIPMASPDLCLNAADSAMLFLYEITTRNKE